MIDWMTGQTEGAPEVSEVAPDWSREQCRRWWDPGPQLLKSLRSYQKWRARRGLMSRLMQCYFVLGHRFWSAVGGADIPLNSKIAGGLLLIHTNGIVIHPGATVGPNCLLFHQVTLGTHNDEQAPVLGSDVLVGAGAKILGGVRIGHHARIGANAVVLCDVPDGATAVGVPARVVQQA